MKYDGEGLEDSLKSFSICGYPFLPGRFFESLNLDPASTFQFSCGGAEKLAGSGFLQNPASPDL
jgi:hypothetical protein